MIRKVTFCLFIALIFSRFLSAQPCWQTHYEKSGCQETPRYDETYRYSRMLADSSAMISLLDYGVSPQGRQHFALVLDRDGLSDPEKIRASGRVILMVEACIHPGEPEGKDAGLLFFRNIAIWGMNRDLLEHVSVLFIPIVNVDGHERFGPYNRINQNGPREMGWRTTSTNLNLNRDFLKADAPEMVAWLKLFNHWMPDFFMDIHTTDGADYQYVITYGVEVFGNMDAGLTRWINEQYLPDIRKSMTEEGHLIFPYVTFTRWHDPRSGLRSRPSTPRYSVGYAAARNRAGILVETHMLKPYDIRVEATLELLIKTAGFIGKQHKALSRLNQQADDLCISGALLNDSFPLTFRLTDQTTPIPFLGYQYSVVKSDLTGNDWFVYSDTPVTFTLDWYHDNIPEKSARIPDYYLIPAGWTDIIERLACHGIEMSRIPKDTSIEVSLYRFSGVRFASQPYEGRMAVNDFMMEEFTSRVHFPAGSVLISTRQQAARVIAHALEPGSPDSFLQWGFFNTIFEQKEYAESYVMEKMAREMIAKDPGLLQEFKAYEATLPDNPGKMWAQYNWLYSRTPYRDAQKDLYPVGRIFTNFQ